MDKSRAHRGALRHRGAITKLTVLARVKNSR
jgi:hypothetical protein